GRLTGLQARGGDAGRPAGCVDGVGDPLGALRLGDHELLGPVGQDLLDDELRAGAADGEPVDPGDVRVACEDVQRLRPEGAGGAELEQAAGGCRGHGTEALTSETWSR